MAYQLTPEDQKTLDFLTNANVGQGPLAQFNRMADQRGTLEPASSVVNKFSGGGSMNPRVAALMERLAQMRNPLNVVDAPFAGER